MGFKKSKMFKTNSCKIVKLRRLAEPFTLGRPRHCILLSRGLAVFDTPKISQKNLKKFHRSPKLGSGGIENVPQFSKKKQQIELLNQNTNWAAHFRTIFAKFCKCQWRRRVPGLEEGRSERKQRFGLGASLHARHDTRCQQTLAEHSGPVTGPGLPLVPLRPSFFLPTPVGALSWCTCSCPPPPGVDFWDPVPVPTGPSQFSF